MNGVAMTTFTIDTENNITAFDSFEEANTIDHAGQIFTSPEEFQTITASWPYARLVETYNSLPGIVTVKKFATRRIAAVRIWEALNAMNGLKKAAKPVKEERGATQAGIAALRSKLRKAKKEKAAVDTKRGDRNRGAAKPGSARKQANVAKGSRKAAGAPTARDGSKKAEVLRLLQRSQGATLGEIMTATGWQSHTVRGFISGTVGKKLGISVESTRTENQERRYRVTA